MGNTTSHIPATIDVDHASLLGVPLELRIMLLRYVPASNRRALRLTCWGLSDYIDEYLGPSDCLTGLHDKASKDRMSFYASTYFPKLEISKSCLFDGLQNLLYKTWNVKSICLMETGSLNANVFMELLQKAKGRLQYLKLNGTIHRSIPHEEEMIYLPKLKFLCVDLKFVYYDFPRNPGKQHWNYLREIPEREIMRAEIVSRMWWDNTLTLLRSLSAPNCAEISWSLYYQRNAAAENFDEVEQAQAFFDFLSRHRSCKNLKIQSKTNRSTIGRPILTLRHSYFHQRAKALALGAEDHLQGPAGIRIPTGEFGIREFSYTSEIQEPTRLEGYLFQFLLSLNGLERLNLDVRHYKLPEVVIVMDAVNRIILNNQNTLTTLVLKAVQNEEFMDFGFLSYCTSLDSLQVIWLEISSLHDELGLNPIRNFWPSENMLKNLTALVLTEGCGLEVEDLKSLPKLKKLKHLALYWYDYDMQIIPLEDFVPIMLMRSLEGLVIYLNLIRLDGDAGANTRIGDWKRWNDAGEQGNEPWALTMRQVFFPLRQFLKSAWLYLSDRKTQFWRMHTRTYPNYESNHLMFTAPGSIRYTDDE